MFTKFDPETYYRSTDPALCVVATPGTLRVWRCQKRGPRYYKFGGKVVYSGKDLNDYIDSCAVDPAAA